jgi:serine/threonine protein kinase
MSPEQIQGDLVTRQSDVFAAGITFYEMLAGKRPFGDGIRAVSAILREEPEALTLVPEPFAQIVFKALEKQLTERYSTARAMQLDLETVLRAQNSYVGQREIAVLIRELRGLSVSDLSTEDLDVGLFSSHRGEIAAVGTSAEMPIFNPRNRSSKWPYVAAVSGVVGSALIALFISQSGHTIPENTTLILGESSVVEADTSPNMLFERAGVPVVIRTLPNSDIYHMRKKVGSTPLTTRLTPGNYKIQFQHGDVSKKLTLGIPADTALVQKDLRLSDLEDFEEEISAKPETKPKSKSSKSNAKGGFFDKIKKAIK